MRSLDHVVLPFASPAHARTTFETLGFTVAPDAVHPFGTGNTCVFLADGTYLEPLVIADPVAYRNAKVAGNRFVLCDAAFRPGRRLPAISALGLRSSDAVADREALAAAGLADDQLVDFSRDFTTDGGEASILSFRLAFAHTGIDRDLTLFVCEPRHGSAPDRTLLTRHANGAIGLKRLVLSDAARPAVTSVRQALERPTVEKAEDRIDPAADLANVGLEFHAAPALADRFGIAPAPSADRAAMALGLIFATPDLTRLRACLDRGAVSVHEMVGRLVVPLGLHSTFIAFEEP
ncbi:VOC family protein [Jiella sp. MQZ9-1]|uniref:VOC family protein n=1 Tax=Jiella flava TaxID=2816857 RepID=A0A939FTD7_9HYPH|nr:VOC family protein [Jiella flava]MBO0661035.1 VOC family protein [Jiella flava]MCD2469683.1 VOC family protein [Jiella flava]